MTSRKSTIPTATTSGTALRDVAQGIGKAVIRPHDICVRYAGDEFIVVLAGCGRDRSREQAVELQQAIGNTVFEQTGDVDSFIDLR